MRFIEHANIVGGARDFWDYIRADKPHRWGALGLSIAIAILVVYGIARSLYPREEPKRSIIYFESWRADRSDFDVRRAWLQRALEANDRNQKRREAYGAFGQAIGQEFDKARSDREFDEARAQIRQALEDLDRAEAAGAPLPPLPRAQPDAQPEAAAPKGAGAPDSTAPRGAAGR